MDNFYIKIIFFIVMLLLRFLFRKATENTEETPTKPKPSDKEQEISAMELVQKIESQHNDRDFSHEKGGLWNTNYQRARKVKRTIDSIKETSTTTLRPPVEPLANGLSTQQKSHLEASETKSNKKASRLHRSPKMRRWRHYLVMKAILDPKYNQ